MLNEIFAATYSLIISSEGQEQGAVHKYLGSEVRGFQRQGLIWCRDQHSINQTADSMQLHIIMFQKNAVYDIILCFT